MRPGQERATPTEPIGRPNWRWTDQFSIDELEAQTHDLANLCLTSHNSVHGNKPFPNKKGEAGLKTPCYSTSNLFQERELAEYSDWSQKELKKRRRRIESWAFKRWAVKVVAPSKPLPEYEESGD